MQIYADTAVGGRSNLLKKSNFRNTVLYLLSRSLGHINTKGLCILIGK